MRTFLGVPIRVQGQIFGNLYLTEKHNGGEFNDYDLHMVRVLATEAGIAIGNARLYEAARQVSGGSTARSRSPPLSSRAATRTTPWRSSPNRPAISPSPTRE